MVWRMVLMMMVSTMASRKASRMSSMLVEQNASSFLKRLVSLAPNVWEVVAAIDPEVAVADFGAVAAVDADLTAASMRESSG